MREKWYVYARGRYIGWCKTTEAELRRTLVYVTIYPTSHVADVWGRPPKGPKPIRLS